MRKHWKALAAAGAMIVIIIAAVLVITFRPAERPPEAQDSGLHATGSFGFPVSTLRVGEGGTGVAGDGRTIIGYDGTCDSAVQAAANYAPLLRDVNINTWVEQKKALTEISTPGPWFETATLSGNYLSETKDIPTPGFDGGWFTRTDVAAGGMYRVASCDEKATAVVQVFAGSLEARTEGKPLGGYETITLELGWDGDWKITDAQVLAADNDFSGRVKDQGPSGPDPQGPTGALAPLTTTWVNSLFTDKSRDGWIEYANATR